MFVVHQLCLTSRIHRADVEVQQRAYEAAVEREQKLQEQLLAILDLLTQFVEPGKVREPVVLSLDMINIASSDGSGMGVVNGRSLWQRIWGLLGRESSDHDPPPGLVGRGKIMVLP